MTRPVGTILFSLAICLPLLCRPALAGTVSYPVVDTGIDRCYDTFREIPCPESGQAFYGQDAQYLGNSPTYRDNGDGTVSDLVTGLMWSQAVDPRKVDFEEAQRISQSMTLGGFHDWRVPTIKELYSLIDFRGYTGSPPTRGDFSSVPADAIPFIDTDYFDFAYGDVNSGERYIDAQWLSSTKYVSTTMDGMETIFGVNFADGRIKGYGFRKVGTARTIKTFFARYVRGNAYGGNVYVDNGDGTISDRATGLMWMQTDSGKGMNWQQALNFAENLESAGYRDWRLPNAKELQSIVDYSRSPDTSVSPAIDPVFQSTPITNEAGQRDYPFYWASTTHHDGPNPAANAAYVAFGRAIGQMHGITMDVHGAGAQRSDPKNGAPTLARGPQGDARRVINFVRCVRSGDARTGVSPPAADANHYPNRVSVKQLKVENIRSGQNHNNQGQRQPMSFSDRSLQPGGGKGFIHHLDKDGDGRVSRSEFDGPPDRFDFHDRNRDGYLTEDEAPQGPLPGRRTPQY